MNEDWTLDFDSVIDEYDELHSNKYQLGNSLKKYLESLNIL